MTNNENDMSNIFFQTITPDTSNDTTPQNAEQPMAEIMPESQITQSASAESVQTSATVQNSVPVQASDTVQTSQAANSAAQDNYSIPAGAANSNNMFVPTGNTSPNNNGISPKKKPKEKSMFLPIAAVCLILVIAVSAVAFVLLSGRDKKTSLNDQPSLFEGLFNFQSPIDDYLGTENIEKEIISGKSEFSGEFTLTNMPTADEYEGLNINYAFKRDADSKEMGFDIGAKYNNANVLSANMYMNKDTLQFKIPSMAEDVFIIEFDKFFDKLKESWNNEDTFTESDRLVLDKYLSKENIAAFLGDWAEFSNNSDMLSTYVHAIEQTYPEDYKKIVDGITTEKAPSDEYGNSGTVYTISEDSIELFVKCLLTVTLDNKELYSKYGSLIGNTSSTFFINPNADDTDNEDEESLEKLHSDLDSISSAFAMLFNEDVTFTVWKNKNGLLTGLESSTDINIAGEIFTLEAEILSYNDTNPSDNMSIRFSIIYEDEFIDLNFDRLTEVGEELSVSHTFSINVSDEGGLMMTFDETLDTTDNSYNCDMAMSISDEDCPMMLGILLSGKFEDLVKGKSYNLVIDNLSCVVDSENIFTLEGNAKVSTKDVSISAPKGTRTTLTDMSADELDEWFNEIFSDNTGNDYE